MRILVTITPQMYRQAIALSIRSRRPEYAVMTASPEAAAGEIAAFEPHLLLHNDNDELGSEVVAGVLCRITVLYTDGMDTRITTRREVREAPDMSTEDLLRVVDATSNLAGGRGHVSVAGLADPCFRPRSSQIVRRRRSSRSPALSGPLRCDS